MKKKALKVLADVLGFSIVFCAAFGSSPLVVSAETEYEYDDLNRLTEERRDDGTVIYYSYDSNGNLLEVKVEEGSDTENKDPDESSGKNPDGNQDGNAGGSQGGGLENKADGKTGDGKGNAAGDNGGNHTGNDLEGNSEGTGGSGLENGSERGEEEGISGNNGGNGTASQEKEGNATDFQALKAVNAKVLTAVVVLIAALSGGLFIWKKKKSTENKDK